MKRIGYLFDKIHALANIELANKKARKISAEEKIQKNMIKEVV